MERQLSTAERMAEAHRRFAADPTGWGTGGPSTPDLTADELAVRVERARREADNGNRGAQAWLTRRGIAEEADLWRWGYRVGAEDRQAFKPPVAPFKEGTASYSGYFRGYNDQGKAVA